MHILILVLSAGGYCGSINILQSRQTAGVLTLAPCLQYSLNIFWRPDLSAIIVPLIVYNHVSSIVQQIMLSLTAFTHNYFRSVIMPHVLLIGGLDNDRAELFLPGLWWLAFWVRHWRHFRGSSFNHKRHQLRHRLVSSLAQQSPFHPTLDLGLYCLLLTIFEGQYVRLGPNANRKT